MGRSAKKLLNLDAAGRVTIGRMSVDPTHWGTFEAVSDGERLTGVRPWRGDPEPTPLIDNVASAQHHPARITQPHVRKGWLDHGPGAGARRRTVRARVVGDRARPASGELRRVDRDHGAEAVYGGSYGWASAGRFHHAQSQVHRFLNCSAAMPARQQLQPRHLHRPAALRDRRRERAADPRHGQVRDRGAHRPRGRLRRAVAEERRGVSRRGVPAPYPRLDERRARPRLPVRLGEPAARRHARRGAGRMDRAAARHRRRADARARPGPDAEGLADTGFLDRYTVGFSRFARYLRGEATALSRIPRGLRGSPACRRRGSGSSRTRWPRPAPW